MKILVISNMYPSTKDPVYGTFVKEFMDSIVKKNRSGKTELIAIKGRSKNVIGKVYKYFIFYFRSLFELLFFRYDLIYVHTITYPIIPIKFVSIFKKLPLVFNTHGADLLGGGMASYLRKLSKPILNQAISIVSPSNYFKKEIIKFLPDYPAEKIFVSPSGGVNTTLFAPSKNRTNHEVFIMGFVSRIDKGKGWDLFLNALNDMRQKYGNVKGIIAGRGAQTKEMMDLISQLDLNNFVDYVGPVPHDKLPSVFTQMDCFIFPSMRESLGLVGLEAMACGIPVIASDSHGPTDYIEDRKNGFLFSTGDICSLIDKVDYYYNLTDSEKNIISGNARKSSLKYDTDYIMDKLYDYLRTL